MGLPFPGETIISGLSSAVFLEQEGPGQVLCISQRAKVGWLTHLPRQDLKPISLDLWYHQNQVQKRSLHHDFPPFLYEVCSGDGYFPNFSWISIGTRNKPTPGMNSPQLLRFRMLGSGSDPFPQHSHPSFSLISETGWEPGREREKFLKSLCPSRKSRWLSKKGIALNPAHGPGL